MMCVWGGKFPKFKMSHQSKRIHGWRSASSIDLRVKISFFFFLKQTLRIRGALPTTEQASALMAPERACGSSPGDGSTLSSTSQQPPYFNSAAQRALLNAHPSSEARRLPTFLKIMLEEYNASYFQLLREKRIFAPGGRTSRHLFRRRPRRFTGSGGRSHRQQTAIWNVELFIVTTLSIMNTVNFDLTENSL